MDDWCEATRLRGCDATFVAAPWKNFGEVVALHDQIFDLSEQAREQGIEEIFAWQLRGHVPLPVQSTALLVQAQLFDKPAVNSPTTIRMVYATAVIRFVTGLCDAFQPRSGEKLPMQTVGMLLNLPVKLVDVRHDATHKDFPSLQRLREAARDALSWLRNNYWQELQSGMVDRRHGANVDETSDVQLQLQNTLKSYLTTRRTEIKKRSQMTHAGKEASLDCIRICGSSTQHFETLAQLLVEVKMLMPANRQLGDSMAGAFLLWNDLLQRLAILQPLILTTLTSHMLNLMSAANSHKASLDPQREAVFSWLSHILTSSAWTAVRQTMGNFDVLQTHVLSDCFSRCSYWSLKLAEDILSHADDDTSNDWAPLLKAVQAGANGTALEIKASRVGLTEPKSPTEEREVRFRESLPAGWARWQE